MEHIRPKEKGHALLFALFLSACQMRGTREQLGLAGQMQGALLHLRLQKLLLSVQDHKMKGCS